jgi:hypothetical protein
MHFSSVEDLPSALRGAPIVRVPVDEEGREIEIQPA